MTCVFFHRLASFILFQSSVSAVLYVCMHASCCSISKKEMGGVIVFTYIILLHSKGIIEMCCRTFNAFYRRKTAHISWKTRRPPKKSPHMRRPPKTSNFDSNRSWYLIENKHLLNEGAPVASIHLIIEKIKCVVLIGWNGFNGWKLVKNSQDTLT